MGLVISRVTTRTDLYNPIKVVSMSANVRDIVSWMIIKLKSRSVISLAVISLAVSQPHVYVKRFCMYTYTSVP